MRANVLTVFNGILAVLGAVTLVFGDWRDALFLAILVGNSAIGITQELRAKRALDRLAALVAPQARVVRDGTERDVAVEDVVVGDLVRLQAGDQVVADGEVAESAGLALDESNLTGESRPVPKSAGDSVQSGSFALEGSGAYLVEAVGADSYAQRIVGEAREFRHPRSPLERAINRLLFVLVAIMVPLGAIFVYALYRADDPEREAVPTAVAGIVTLVPEGLILLASLTYAAAALRMSRRGALAQQLNAIESLASVDVLCLDKTGTLTESSLRVVGIEPAPGVDRAQLEEDLARFAASSPSSNSTLRGDLGRTPCGAGGSRRARPVLVAQALERPTARRRQPRPRRARALLARRPPRHGLARGRLGPARAGLRQGAAAVRGERRRTARGGARGRARRARRGAAAPDPRHRRLLPARGRGPQGHLRRRARNRGRDRAGRGHPGRWGAARRRLAPRRRPGAAGLGRPRHRGRPHLAGGQEAPRRGAPRRRPLRRDGRGRRQRRAGAQGGTARDRAGQRLGDGALA